MQKTHGSLLRLSKQEATGTRAVGGGKVDVVMSREHGEGKSRPLPNAACLGVSLPLHCLSVPLCPRTNSPVLSPCFVTGCARVVSSAFLELRVLGSRCEASIPVADHQSRSGSCQVRYHVEFCRHRCRTGLVRPRRRSRRRRNAGRRLTIIVTRR